MDFNKWRTKKNMDPKGFFPRWTDYNLKCALKFDQFFSIVSEKSLSGGSFEFNSFSQYQWMWNGARERERGGGELPKIGAALSAERENEEGWGAGKG